jgi:hypothetical protein
MTDVDLDIRNYNLEDILNLFKLPPNFNETHLKRAKHVVLQTHPDKSKLHPDYFRFYTKAYKMLYSIWEFKKSATTESLNSYNTDYASLTYNEEQKKELLDEFFQSNKKNFKTSRDFNKWFNQQFEKNKLETEADSKGYEEWLRSSDESQEQQEQQATMATMGQLIDQKKSQLRALIVHQDVAELVSNTNASDLLNAAPSSFDSDMFSQLTFQDLHKAHTQTVIPVTEEDYHAKQRFNNVNEIMHHRSQQDTRPLSEQQALQYLKTRTQSEDEMATRRAYQLAKEAELVKQREQDFWAGIQFIKDKGN